MYVDTFRSTFAVDILEHFNLVQVTQEINSRCSSESASVNSSKHDLEALKSCDSDILQMADDSSAANKEKEEVSGNKDPFLVEFSGAEDPELPVNWSFAKKALVVFEVMILTAVTYMGSSIYTPGQEAIQKQFGVGHVVGTLNLSMYVLGYGLGPMVFSPLSEFAIFGRQQLYILTIFLYSMLQVGCALVNNIAGLVILRFITGILCSPSLATGAASVSEVVHPQFVPIMIGLWSIGAVAAPATGPIIGAAMFVAKGWRFMFWILMWLSAATFVFLVLFFPETSMDNILYRRCMRIRKITGDERYYTVKAKEEAKLTTRDLAAMALWRPFEIILKEPIVVALDAYIALGYGTFYLFFEAFPIVFVEVHHFTVIQLGLAYLGFSVGSLLAFMISLSFFTLYLPPIVKRGKFTPEILLKLSMWVCWCGPLALFLFGWTASMHWILPIIAELFFVLFLFNLFQAVFAYLATSYPKYVASVFAGNGLFRASFACAFPLFGRAMYDNLAIDGYPVGWGSSIVGFTTVALAAIPFILYKAGPCLRSKSSFSA
ncbi:probable Fluconazole resistance protein 1 [Zygosaccharomyces bailii]|nr:probable Fluconazole resistance protein 1 [Zygosaccharomyces bailii]